MRSPFFTSLKGLQLAFLVWGFITMALSIIVPSASIHSPLKYTCVGLLVVE